MGEPKGTDVATWLSCWGDEEEAGPRWLDLDDTIFVLKDGTLLGMGFLASGDRKLLG